MNYDILNPFSPIMPQLGKGTECISLILSQVSPDMREVVTPMLFPALGAYMSGVEFQYPDLTWKEPCGMMAHLIADSGMGKGQLTSCIEAIMRKFRKHDDEEMQKLVEWQRQVKTKGANKEKPVRPDVAFWFPPSDITNAAFIQNAMACELVGMHSQYQNMAEIEMADRLCGGHKQVSQVIRNIYDRQRAGALRATADGVTGNPTLRVNMTFSSTPFAARKFYKTEIHNGTFGRMVFSYKPRGERSGKIPRQGMFDDEFLEQLDSYLVRLEACKGKILIPQLNRLTDKLAADLVAIADLADDDTLWDMGKRALVSAWKNGCILYVLNGQQWTASIAHLVGWFVYHDIWSKMQVFGDMFNEGDFSAKETQRRGPKNMLDDLPDTFNEAKLDALRMNQGKTVDGSKSQLRKWVFRKFIIFDAETGLYTKTAEYLNGITRKSKS